MFRTDVPTASGVLPTPSAPGTPGYFTNGNLALGIPSTIVDQDWANRIQEELMSALTQAGITPVKSNFTQLVAAIRACNVLNDVSASVNVLIANPTPPWTPIVIGTQAVLVPAITNTGPSTLNTSSGGALNILRPDGTILQPGDLKAGQRHPLVYDGVAWRMINWTTRIRLSGPLQLFCNQQIGNDNNNGLTSGTSFASMTGAYNWLYQNADVSGQIVTVQCSGNFTTGLVAQNVVVGATPQSIVFNFAAGSTINVGSGNCILVQNPGVGITVSGPVVLTAANAGIIVSDGAKVLFSGFNLGACAFAQVAISADAVAVAIGNYNISAGAPAHMIANGGQISTGGITVTITGTPAFSSSFLVAAYSGGAIIYNTITTYTGSATGKSYNVQEGANIHTSGTTIPGNVSGTAGSGLLAGFFA